METEPKATSKEDKKIHKTHFPVIKIPLKETSHDSGFQWVDLGNGTSVRIPKKTEVKSNSNNQ